MALPGGVWRLAVGVAAFALLDPGGLGLLGLPLAGLLLAAGPARRHEWAAVVLAAAAGVATLSAPAETPVDALVHGYVLLRSGSGAGVVPRVPLRRPVGLGRRGVDHRVAGARARGAQDRGAEPGRRAGSAIPVAGRRRRRGVRLRDRHSGGRPGARGRSVGVARGPVTVAAPRALDAGDDRYLAAIPAPARGPDAAHERMTMEIILREDVAHLGTAGAVVKGKDGDARNYLLPQGLPYPAPQADTKRIAHEAQPIAKQRPAQKAAAQGEARRIAEVS